MHLCGKVCSRSASPNWARTRRPIGNVLKGHPGCRQRRTVRKEGREYVHRAPTVNNPAPSEGPPGPRHTSTHAKLVRTVRSDVQYRTRQHIRLYMTMQHRTIQHGSVQNSTVPCHTVQYSTEQDSTVQYITVQFGIVQGHRVQYNVA